MGVENITVDEILADMLESVGDREPPTREDGWVSFAELMDASNGLTLNQMRDRAGKMVKSGKWEKLIWGRVIYYRKVTT